MATPSPILPLPLDSQTQLVSDLLNVLIGVASTTFPLGQVRPLSFGVNHFNVNQDVVDLCSRDGHEYSSTGLGPK